MNMEQEQPKDERDPSSIRGLACIPLSVAAGALICGIWAFAYPGSMEGNRLSREESGLFGLVAGAILGLILGGVIWAFFPYKKSDKEEAN